MGRGGYDRQIVIRRDVDHSGAQCRQLGPCFGDIATDGRSDLDLRTQELGNDLTLAARLAFLDHRLGRVVREVHRLGIDEEIFLFDPHREAWKVQQPNGLLWVRS